MPTIRNAANAQLVRVVCTDGLPVRDGNPHLWMDPEFARAYVAKIRDALVAADPGARRGLPSQRRGLRRQARRPRRPHPRARSRRCPPTTAR